MAMKNLVIRSTHLGANTPLKCNEREFFRDVTIRLPHAYVCSIPVWVYILQEEHQECPVIIFQEVRQRCTVIPRHRKFHRNSVLFALCGSEIPFRLKDSSTGCHKLFCFPSTMLRCKCGNRSRLPCLCLAERDFTFGNAHKSFSLLIGL